MGFKTSRAGGISWESVKVGIWIFKIGDIYSDAMTLKQASKAVSYVEEQRDKIEKKDIQMLDCRLEKYMAGEFRLNL